MTRWQHTLDRLETRVQALTPAAPTPDHFQQQMLDWAAATIGAENAAQFEGLIPTGGHWFPRQLIATIAFGGPDSELTRSLTYYEEVRWASPLPAALEIVTTWLQSPAGQERWLDPYWLLRYEIEHGLCGHKAFAYDLATAAVLAWGTLEAQASLPTPPAPTEQYGPWTWRKSLEAYWDALPPETLWPYVGVTGQSLAAARHPEVFTDIEEPTRPSTA